MKRKKSLTGSYIPWRRSGGRAGKKEKTAWRHLMKRYVRQLCKAHEQNGILLHFHQLWHNPGQLKTFSILKPHFKMLFISGYYFSHHFLRGCLRDQSLISDTLSIHLQLNSTGPSQNAAEGQTLSKNTGPIYLYLGSQGNQWTLNCQTLHEFSLSDKRNYTMCIKQSHTCRVFLISYHFKILASFAKQGFQNMMKPRHT